MTTGNSQTYTDMINDAMEQRDWKSFQFYMPKIIEQMKSHSLKDWPQIMFIFKKYPTSHLEMFNCFIKNFYPLMSNEQKFEQLMGCMDVIQVHLKEQQYQLRDHRAFISIVPKEVQKMIAEINFDNKKLRQGLYDKVVMNELFYALFPLKDTFFNQDVEYFKACLDFIVYSSETHTVKPFFESLLELSETKVKMVFLLENWANAKEFMGTTLLYRAFFQSHHDIFEKFISLGAQFLESEVPTVEEYKDYTEEFNTNYTFYEKSKLDRLVNESSDCHKKSLKI